MAKKGILIVYSGPSGVGKSTIRAEVFKNPELKLKYSISMTTRKPRVGEVDGVDYFFVSSERFDEAIKNGELLEHAEFVGNKYGTPKAYVEKLLNDGFNVMLEIEVQGAMQVINSVDCVSIFLLPPSFEELENRIRSRKSESEEVIEGRLAKAASEMQIGEKYMYRVINNSIEQASKEIADIIKKEQEK